MINTVASSINSDVIKILIINKVDLCPGILEKDIMLKCKMNYVFKISKSFSKK